MKYSTLLLTPLLLIAISTPHGLAAESSPLQAQFSSCMQELSFPEIAGYVYKKALLHEQNDITLAKQRRFATTLARNLLAYCLTQPLHLSEFILYGIFSADLEKPTNISQAIDTHFNHNPGIESANAHLTLFYKALTQHDIANAQYWGELTLMDLKTMDIHTNANTEIQIWIRKFHLQLQNGIHDLLNNWQANYPRYVALQELFQTQYLPEESCYFDDQLEALGMRNLHLVPYY